MIGGHCEQKHHGGNGAISSRKEQIIPIRAAGTFQGMYRWGILWLNWSCDSGFCVRGDGMVAAKVIMG
jgi:hypothetical protein